MNTSQVLTELDYKAVRSSGPGGQHVNKTSTKVTLYFDIDMSQGLSEEEKNRLKQKLKSRLTATNVLVLQCGETRSQHRNKTLVTKRFLALLEAGLALKKKRRKTKPSKSAIEKRLRHKKETALKKQNRRRPNLD
ncbi:aminoacyl-tRNA hydrolase [Rasiella rasia]|uniref:Aminoacyl-tRNA hydrolase n=1 Tax=Rasiella rasia TaxID=2744027 RepID=A0A6G6GLS0_9FLAO|nr:alternative ribosome rescue aminoacyl-tRNA hydrolase ArfB [Rasiella rasia]QIE59536.1 aminoacyl-tRNA hydrolase [Rasiella rasia]